MEEEGNGVLAFLSFFSLCMITRNVRIQCPQDSLPRFVVLRQFKSVSPCQVVLLNMFCLFLQGDANSVQVSIQLKLNDKVKNSFEYCEVHLPFFHRFVMFLWFKTMNNSNCELCNDKKKRFIENNDARLILRRKFNGATT